MTITANPARDEYTATASQTVFNYTFKIYDDTDLNVYVTPSGQAPNDGTDITTAYVVDPATIGDPSGGFITFNTPLSAGDLVTIVSDIPENRTTDYLNNGDFKPVTVNADFDRVVSLVKQTSQRGLSFPESVQGVTAELPAPEDNKLLAWDGIGGNVKNKDVGAGPGVAVGDDGQTITISAIDAGSSIDANVYDNLAVALASTAGAVGDFVETREFNGGSGVGSALYKIVSSNPGNLGLINHLKTDGSGNYLQIIPNESNVIDVTQAGIVPEVATNGKFLSLLQASAAPDSDSPVNFVVTAPAGKFILDNDAGLIDQAFEFHGAGRWATVLDSRSGTGWIFDTETSRFTLKNFAMIHNSTGGVRFYKSDNAIMENIFAGFGCNGGITFYNIGSQNAIMRNLTVSSNGRQVDPDNANTPTHAYVFHCGTTGGKPVAARDVFNMTMMDSCQAAGCKSEGFVAINNTTDHAGQGYMVLNGCTFQGNGSVNITPNITVTGCYELQNYHTHLEASGATYDAVISDCQALRWDGGVVGALDIDNTHSCIFFDCVIIEVSEADDCLNNIYRQWVSISNGTYRFSFSSLVESPSASLNKTSDGNTSRYARSSNIGKVLTYNGNFTSWANSSSPKEFYAFGGATIARTTDEYSGAYGCEITAVGATSVQGLACDLDRFEMGEENWVTVCAKIKRPATNAGDIKIIANVGFDRVGTVFQEELPDDEYILVSRSFNIGDTAGAYIVICPASSPSGGESIKVDEVVIMTGKQGPTGFIGKASPHVSLYDEQAGSSREMITFSYASSGPPSSGAYVKGDRVYIPPVASGAEGYVALLDIPDASSPPANAWATFGVIGAAIP